MNILFNSKKLIHNKKTLQINNCSQKSKKKKKTCLNFQENFIIWSLDSPVLKLILKINFKNLISNGPINMNLNKININKDFNLFKRKEITLKI